MARAIYSAASPREFDSLQRQSQPSINAKSLMRLASEAAEGFSHAHGASLLARYLIGGADCLRHRRLKNE